MNFKILGSGGATPVPRPFCQCNICKMARKNPKFKRNSPSAFVKEINALIDCPEDIASSLNRENIKQVDNLFITHWHPDHTFGLRVLLEAYYDFYKGKAIKQVNVYLGPKVYETLKGRFPTINYLTDIAKVAKIHIIEDGEKVNFGKITVQSVGYTGKDSKWYAFLFKEKNKKLLYAPCDTLHFENYFNFKGLDVLVHECGIFWPEEKKEIKFPNLMKRLQAIKPKKTFLTHIEEIELNRGGIKTFKEVKKKYKNINFEFAHDGLKITL